MSQIEESNLEESLGEESGVTEVTPEDLLERISDAIDALQTSQNYAVTQMESIDTNLSEINKIASTTQLGRVKVDGVTVFADENGVLSADPESGDIVSQGSSRNVGEVFYSLIPLVDAGIHLLDGDIILGQGVYKAFVDYMAELSQDSNYANLFVTESEWQTSVSTYGVCGKFVYDTISGNLRLPRVTGLIEGTVNQNAIGDLVQAGLPNITGESSFGSYGSVDTVSGALYKKSCGYAFGGGSAVSNIGSLGIDASLSNSIYGNSNTVQPQTVKGYVYIVLANSTANPVTVQIDNIVTDLNIKADKNLSNVDTDGREIMAHAAMPSGQYIELSASAFPYTAPADGFMDVCCVSTSTGAELTLMCSVDGNTYNARDHNYTQGWGMEVFIPVKKGTVVSIGGTNNLQFHLGRFFYANGSAPTA